MNPWPLLLLLAVGCAQPPPPQPPTQPPTPATTPPPITQQLDRIRIVADPTDEALKRLRALSHTGHWLDLKQEAAHFLARPRLSVMNQIEGHATLALAHSQLGDRRTARIQLEQAQQHIEQHRLGESGLPPIQLAQVSFVEGELRRLASEDIHLTPVPPHFADVLEARCQGLLDAQDAYTEAMRARDPHWSLMSGYRVGQLYQQLHREALAIPAPANASPAQQPLFHAAMRLRYRILLEKGLRMMQSTLALAERTENEGLWTARAREAQEQLQHVLAKEQAALAQGPYTEAELQAALEKLKAD